MTYTYKTERLPLLMILLSQMIGVLMIDIVALRIALVGLMVALILATFVHYEMLITSNKITYTVRLFTLKLRTVELTDEDIYCVWFKRASWAKKKAIIKRKAGFAIPMLSDQSQHFVNHLAEFCTSHDIPIHKTSDYELLERMSTSR